MLPLDRIKKTGLFLASPDRCTRNGAVSGRMNRIIEEMDIYEIASGSSLR